MAEEFIVNDQKYRALKMDPFKQFHIARRLVKVISAIAPAMKNGVPELKDILPIMGSAIAGMSDEDANYILYTCLDYAQREQPTGWARVRSGASVMFEDIDLPTIMQIAWQVIELNLASFMPALPQVSHDGAA